MNRMPNTEISQSELEVMFENPYKTGGEAIICKGTNKTLYKIFIDYNDVESLGYYGNPTFQSLTDMLDNKYEKIKKLYEMQLADCVRPLGTLTSMGRLIGYEMTYDPEDLQFNGYTLPRKELIYYLEQSKKILEYFSSKDITYGDVAGRNILINPRTGNIKFCDMDNIRLQAHPIDLMSAELEDYIDTRGLDESTDTYMHNLFTIQQIDNWGEYERILNAIGNKHYPRGFKLPARKIMQSMESPATFTGESIVQYIKR